MNGVTASQSTARSAPPDRTLRRDLLVPMLEGTKRAFLRIRRSRVQKPRGLEGTRASSLALLARDNSLQDVYLLIHTLASNSAPHVAPYPATTWAHLARLVETATLGSGKARRSTAVSDLASLQLVERGRMGNETALPCRSVKARTSTGRLSPPRAADFVGWRTGSC